MLSSHFKVIPKRKKGIVHAVRDEVEVLKELVHPHILKYLSVEESELEIYVITEYVSCGGFKRGRGLVVLGMIAYVPWDEMIHEGSTREIP